MFAKFGVVHFAYVVELDFRTCRR